MDQKETRKGIHLRRVRTLEEHLAFQQEVGLHLRNAIGIKMAEGDLSEGLLSERPFPADCRIQIAHVPLGDAPEEIRAQWVGVNLDAYHFKNFNGSGEAYLVRLHEAITALAEKSPEAAAWFQTNIAVNMNFLEFKPKDVTLLRHLR